MEIERNAEFVTGLTGARFPARVANLRGMGIDLSIAELTSEFAGNATYYVLFPGASSPGKCWPVERFQEIALRIYRETGWTGVVCGGPADVALARQLRAQAELPLIDRTGRTSLSQLTAILANARLVVANDTSAVHIAAALSVPAICVLGGGHVGRFLPYTTGVSSSAQLPIAVDHPMDCFDCNWECIHAVPAGAPKPCVAGVGVEDIWLKVSDIVANRRSC
jgi:ADP-heptose:LPS heptosyltransferase